MKKHLLLVFLLVLLTSPLARAATWDAANASSGLGDPASAWSYGWQGSLGSTCNSFSAGEVNSGRSLEGNGPVSEGETVDFLVGFGPANDRLYADTPLRLTTIDNTPMHLPAVVLLLCSAVLGLVGLKKKA